MTSDDLGTALRERLADVTVDLEALAAGATRRGRRIRAVRRGGVTLGAVAAVAAVGLGVASLAGTSPSGAPQYASGGTGAAPSPAASLHAGQVMRLGTGVRGFVRGSKLPLPPRTAYAEVPDGDVRGVGTGWTIVIDGDQGAVQRYLAGDGPADLTRIYSGVSVAMPMFGPSMTATPNRGNDVYQGQDVTIHLAGWKQVGPVGDDKQSLEGPGGAVADIVWRPASEHADWVANPDKGATSDVWTSPIHDGVFVTIQGGQGTSATDVQALGDSLTWN